jgi:cell wall-associated NlpC family hydrolase
MVVRAPVRALFCAGLLLAPLPLHAQQAGPPAVAEAQSIREAIVARARAQLGERYRLGGEHPEEGFDCSGLIRYVMSAFDLSLPRTAALQALIGREVPRDPASMRPGDLLTFGTGKRITHIGIYVGNGRYIHASSGSGRIIESELDRPRSSLMRSWQGVRRVLTSSDSTGRFRPG